MFSATGVGWSAGPVLALALKPQGSLAQQVAHMYTQIDDVRADEAAHGLSLASETGGQLSVARSTGSLELKDP